jgi:hypothetical protein
MSTPNPGPSRIASCGGCAAQWSGLERAHCSACHETFSSVTAFTRHRQPTRTRGRCLSPLEVGLSLIGGFWQLPPMSIEVRRALWAARRATSAPVPASASPMVDDVSDERTPS